MNYDFTLSFLVTPATEGINIGLNVGFNDTAGAAPQVMEHFAFSSLNPTRRVMLSVAYQIFDAFLELRSGPSLVTRNFFESVHRQHGVAIGAACEPPDPGQNIGSGSANAREIEMSLSNHVGLFQTQVIVAVLRQSSRQAVYADGCI